MLHYPNLRRPSYQTLDRTDGRDDPETGAAERGRGLSAADVRGTRAAARNPEGDPGTRAERGAENPFLEAVGEK